MLLPLSRSVVAANVVLMTLASTAVILRIVARRMRRLPLKADDFTILAALLIAYGLCIGGIYAGATDLYAIPIRKMSLSKYHEHEKLIWADVLMCHVVYGIIKISILFFYRRIFVIPWFSKTTYAFMAVVVAWMIAAAFGHIFSGSPVDVWWTSSPAFTLAIDYEIFLAAMAGIDIGLDVFTLLLPIPVIRSLHMSKEKKLSLIGVFALGFFCVVASAIRFYYVWQLHLVVKGFITPAKITSISSWNDVWAHIEACASIVTACLPTLVPLFTGLRSFETLYGSFKAFFSIGSGSRVRSSRDHRSSQGKHALPEAYKTKQKWYEMNSHSESTATYARRTQDEESLVRNPESIQVKTSFGSQFEPRL